jgi:hypothetical protein
MWFVVGVVLKIMKKWKFIIDTVAMIKNKANKSSENVSKCKYFGGTIPNQNSIHEDNMSRLYSEYLVLLSVCGIDSLGTNGTKSLRVVT